MPLCPKQSIALELGLDSCRDTTPSPPRFVIWSSARWPPGCVQREFHASLTQRSRLVIRVWTPTRDPRVISVAFRHRSRAFGMTSYVRPETATVYQPPLTKARMLKEHTASPEVSTEVSNLESPSSSEAGWPRSSSVNLSRSGDSARSVLTRVATN